MSETTELLELPHTDAPARPASLSGMVLPDLRALAGKLGIKGTSGMRKGDLIAAIHEKQSGKRSEGGTAAPEHRNGHADGGQPAAGGQSAADGQSTGHGGQSAGPPDASADSGARSAGTQAEEHHRPAAGDAPATSGDSTSEEGGSGRPTDDSGADRDADDSERQPGGEDSGPRDRSSRRNRRNRRDRGGEGSAPESNTETADRQQSESPQRDRQQSDRPQADRQQGDSPQRDRQPADRQQGDRQQSDSPQRERQQSGGRPQQGPPSRDNDDSDADGPRRGRRYRDRNRRNRDRFGESPPDTEVRDDDVLLPVAGILDVLDSYAFVRTSGYLTGSNDVYVSLAQVRKHGLRRGDAVTGAVRAPRDGENSTTRQKFNALVRLDSVNGLDPDLVRNRPEFTKLTPLYPNERLRLETEAHLLTTRVIDLVMPVGKGQRALIVSPPKAGKTSVLQAIANAITTNNPECHLMVVLVDERPEEVTDMQRSVKGEVIASTFDRPPSDHTQVAELAIERAKRLVEMGRDVVVLLDSITRLGRAYNLAAPASGRILSGGVDSTALFPPKRFLGAARNIENGGSLTIFASALVETGSAGDTVIFEEFKGTGNAELKLDRRLADKRIFPAIDIDQSSTRKEDLLMSPDEHAVTLKLRRVLGALDSQQSLELVLDRLRKTRSNVEFLMQVAATTPNADRD